MASAQIAALRENIQEQYYAQFSFKASYIYINTHTHTIYIITLTLTHYSFKASGARR